MFGDIFCQKFGSIRVAHVPCLTCNSFFQILRVRSHFKHFLIIICFENQIIGFTYDLALPMIVALAAEVLLMVVFSLLVVFPVMGRDYDAAMITAGFIGFGMGATSNAMANMQAVSRRYGPSPSAYFVIPMVGGLFNDFFNAAIIAFCIGLLA